MKKNFILIILSVVIFACNQNQNTTKKKKIPPPKKVVNYRKNVTNSLQMKLVYIKPGTFLMGPDYKLHYSGREDEVPHKVTLTIPFYMQTTETTIGQWKKFIKDTKYKTQAEKDGFSWYCGGYRYSSEKKKGYSWKNPGYKYNDKFPVNNISRDDSLAFLNWLSKKEGATYRLPTEAEWEYACHAGTTTHFPGGNLSDNWYDSIDIKMENKSLDSIAWYCTNSSIKPHQVGLKKPNPWGYMIFWVISRSFVRMNLPGNTLKNI
jgi:formylglycine-generating enzyme required for sulfatase activity